MRRAASRSAAVAAPSFDMSPDSGSISQCLRCVRSGAKLKGALGQRLLPSWRDKGGAHLHVSEPIDCDVRQEVRRQFPRQQVECRARICIGTRHYAGYLHNISQGGAKLRTITPIRKLGRVLLRLPDLPPIRCSVAWTDSYNAGVAFELPLAATQLRSWLRTRSGVGLPAELSACNDDIGVAS